MLVPLLCRVDQLVLRERLDRLFQVGRRVVLLVLFLEVLYLQHQ